MNTQVKVITLIARGDTLEQVGKATGLATSTVQGIRDRNQDALSTIKEKMITHQVTSSKKILDKAHAIIESKLDKIETGEEEATLTELNSISKEAFHQSQIEAGKPTGITAGSHETTAQLTALVNALNNGDEVELYKMVLNPSQPEANQLPHETILEGELAS